MRAYTPFGHTHSTLMNGHLWHMGYGIWIWRLEKRGENPSEDRKHKADKEQHVGRQRERGEGRGEKGRQGEGEQGNKKWITFHFGN